MIAPAQVSNPGHRCLSQFTRTARAARGAQEHPLSPNTTQRSLYLLAALIGVVIALEMAYVLMGGFRETPVASMSAAVVQVSNTKALGILLYTEYLYPVQIAAVILVVAMIAAIALTLRERKDTKFVAVSDQIHVKPGDRMKLVKVDVTKPALPPVPPAAAEAAPAPAAPGEKKA